MSASTHSPVLKHHFEDLGQQHACERLGIWMFLTTEILFFGGLFAAYTVYRMYYPAEFVFASSYLNRTFATVNTMLLITSSLTITLAIRSAKLGDRAAVIRNLLITAALASAFMVVKGFEYNNDFEERYVAGAPFRVEYDKAVTKLAPLSDADAAKFVKDNHANKHPEIQHWAAQLALHNREGVGHGALDPGKVQLFLCFYYIMTGIHGIHIIIGIGCILWVAWEAWRGTVPPENYSTVEVVSLYWHLVDAIWLFLMPLLYLAGAGAHH
ncbi:Cytochrome c oxidase polypeptide I+III [Gemmata obscuriglobus]|nr:cytochrome c oxidase subunit 3 [Gemmata obscuriglobus]QEG31283.1 Cytochrome c oxidase polypeptide I+III [Gemmata obscuriglobus]VTS10622.1 cytochrome c oxidase subunit iii : Cytochrome c oxidase subunit III OS=Rhodothermus marinus SG0.5JP17-172 GN=Rhom172_0214 PE=3 SV=1: COX3: COX3 [Gemmata obscuriglobus UQM 2246]